MLSPEHLQSPRPRPPAQLRRSGSTPAADRAPPPPYAFEFPTFPDGHGDDDPSDPVAATAKIMGMQLDAEIDASSIPDITNKTRDELANLFLQAEKIIRAREAELTVAANLGKSLLETNEALKQRHDALLSRLPAMQSPVSTVPGPSNLVPKSHSDAWTTDDDIPSLPVSRIHSRTNSLVGSVRSTPVHSRANSIILSGETPSPRRTHARRISASPSALIALSETNTELIAELTRLRAATDSAQVEGAHRLRKLEREIGGLKAELEASQRTNAELEEKVKEQVAEERKRERDERLRKLRLGPETHASDSDREIRDFAPPGSGANTWDSVNSTPRPEKQVRVVHHFDSESEGPYSDWNEASESGSASSTASSRRNSRNNTITPSEYAVVAQLYRKVEELQEANAELGARNRVTSEQLARAEREALEIKRVYEEIGEEIGNTSDSEDIGLGTIRAASSQLSRNITPKAKNWSLHRHRRSFDEQSGDTTPRPATGSRRALGNKNMFKGTHTLKSRKPLTDTLFAPLPVAAISNTNTGPGSPATHSPSLPHGSKPKSGTKGKLKPKVKSVTLPPLSSLARHRKISVSSQLSSASIRTSTTASSFLTASVSSLASISYRLGRSTARRSLGSELGVEFGEDWSTGVDAPGYRNLFDDAAFRAELEELEAYSDEESEDENIDDVAQEEDPAIVALRDALGSPYGGRLLEQDEHILPVGALRASPGEAFQLVAHAVVMRPNRWLESDDRRVHSSLQHQVLADRTYFTTRTGEDPWETTRYPDIEPSVQQEIEERGSVRMLRRGLALERMASTANARRLSDTFELVPSTSQLQTADYYPRRSRRAALVETIKRTSAEALVEFWIFLQFVVVICVFIYTTSRRGPREVLGAPPRRVT